MIITKEWLKSKDISQSQFDIFLKEWPEGFKLNWQNLERAWRLGLDLGWLAKSILTSSDYEIYGSHRYSLYIEYRKKITPIYIANTKKLDLLDSEFGAKKDLIWDKYQERLNVCWSRYQKESETLEEEIKQNLSDEDYERKDQIIFVNYQLNRTSSYAEYKSKIISLEFEDQKNRKETYILHEADCLSLHTQYRIETRIVTIDALTNYFKL